MIRSLASALVAASLFAPFAQATDGLRVMAWNISNYNGGRVADIQNVMYGEFDNRSAEPDVILLQEIGTFGALNAFVDALNTAPTSPGDWAAGNFLPNSGNIHPALVYRTSKLEFNGATLVSVGSGSPNHPRNVVRYDMNPVGYDEATSTIAMYPSHMKAGSSSSDIARRLQETLEIRADAESLPSDWSFILGGDFNTQSSTQSAYQELVGFQANNDGRFFDPINRPGNWNNSSTFRVIHTQDPAGGGGMDDRHDQILISGSLIDGEGVDYIGNQAIPFSLLTWDDPNHSYRCLGNDGTSYNTSLTTTGNANVGPSIAQSLINTASGGGHLPVYLDLRVAALLGGDIDPSNPTIDLGTVDIVGGVVSFDVDVENVADVALWGTNGIDDLDYEFAPVTGIGVPAGPFSADAGSTATSHTMFVAAATPGTFNGSFQITSDDPGASDVVVTVTANFVNACPADVNGDGSADPADFTAWLGCFNNPASAPFCDRADVNNSGMIDPADFTAWLAAFNAGCL